jgi:RNA 2',3'-cyclic 3'-phosphodiesterase
VRCFVALDLPAGVRNHLVNLTQPLRERFDVKWVPADQLHLTLVFAGELDDEATADLVAIVEDVVLPPITLHLEQLGHFPPRGIPRVLWAGLGGDVAAVTALHQELVGAASHLGIEREKRGFTPHVTLGRVKSDFGALALLDELRTAGDNRKQKPFIPTELVLYRSRLRPSGPEHVPLLRRPVPTSI